MPNQTACIVIPTYNRPRELARCLEYLAALEDGPWPVIVVDDGSDAPLGPVCEPYDNVSLVRQENAGPGAARNCGAREADGYDLLLFIDDDCRPAPDWASRLVAVQGGVVKRLVGGRITNALPDNPYSSASQSLSSFLYEYYQANGSAMTFFTTNNMCCRREDFLSVGGFDAGFAIASEDRDLSLRWRDAGGELVYEPAAVIAHAHELSLPSFWRQHHNYGRGARTLHLALDRRSDPRPKLESVRFYFGMLTSPFRHGGRRPVAEALLVGLSQVAMVSGYAASLREERGRRRA
ncbi:MAG: glycosyltransferase family 2 protein [Erythrobacter sp.]